MAEPALICPVCDRAEFDCACSDQAKAFVKRARELAGELLLTRERLTKSDRFIANVAYDLNCERCPDHELLEVALRNQLVDARAHRKMVAGGCPHGCVAPCSFHRRIEEVRGG